MVNKTKKLESKKKKAKAKQLGISAYCKLFTLIELLIVIAIIGILASLLLPALKIARDQAKEVLCYSNQKQNYLSIMMYCNDFNGWLPLSWTAETNGESARDYLPISKNADKESFDDMKIMRCPGLDNSVFWGYSYSNGVGTYATATYLWGRDQGISARPLHYWNKGVTISAPVSKNVKPPDIPLIICGLYCDGDSIYFQAFGRHYNTGGYHILYPHNKRVAIRFLDGHQGSVKGVYGSGDNEIATVWNNGFNFPVKIK